MAKTITLQDVAAKAGVSTATVSRVINQKGPVSERTRLRVTEAMETLNFTAPGRRRQPGASRNRGRTIAVVLNHLEWPVVPNWIAELHHTITSFGCNTIVAASEGGAVTRRHCLNLIVNEQVDGAIFYSPHGETYAEIATTLGIDAPFRFGRGMFCVDIGRRRGFHIVTDEDQIGRMASSHLIGAGARHLAIIGGPSRLPASQSREEAFLRGAEAFGYAIDQVPMEHAESWNFDGGYSAMDSLLARQQPMDGLFISSDHAAIGAMRLLHERGIEVKGRMAIVSVDNMAQAAYSIPSLTTIDTRLRERAELAVSELMHLLDDEDAQMDDVTVGVRLVVRESSRSLTDAANP